MQRICSSLSQAGYDVTLIGRHLPDSKVLKEMPFKQKRLKCIFNKGKLFYLEYNLRLFIFFLFLRKFDAICAVDLDTLLAGTKAAKLRRKKIIYDAHEYFTQVPEVVERPKVQKIWNWVAQRCIPRCDSAYTVCQSLASEFKKLYGKDFEVIRNLPLAQPLLDHKNDRKKPFILLYQGMLNDGRGLEEMLLAMQQFNASEVQFWLAGEGDLSESLRKLAEELKLGERVKFLGFVDPSELKMLTKESDIGINLLKNKGLNYYYSLANKFFDYVMAEKPSINMDFPEYRLHCEEFEVGLLLKDLNSETIVNAVNSILLEERYEELKANCLRAKAVWTWEQEAEKLLLVYKKLFL
jgi:glycosyltransferase involved in cell wall biosynthesis